MSGIISRMREPDINGPVARAWKVKNNTDNPDHQASVGSWLINGPFHPHWSWWSVGVVHLRDVPGQSKPAHKQYPEAEYEFMIWSVNPEFPSPDPDNPGEGYHFLQPPDVIEQFHGVSDRDAARICESMVIAITRGIMSPDSDWRSKWKTSLCATVEHFRSGAHAEN